MNESHIDRKNLSEFLFTANAYKSLLVMEEKLRDKARKDLVLDGLNEGGMFEELSKR